MAKGYATATQRGLRAALIADPGVAALVGDRVVDEPGTAIVLPYVRFNTLEPVHADTDGRLGATVTVGLQVHSRPIAGRTEATQICEAIDAALHRQPGALTVVGHTVVDIEVLAYLVTRAADGATYLGNLSLRVDLDA